MLRFFKECRPELRMLRIHARILPGGCCAVLHESSLIGTFLLNFPANQFPGLEGQLWGATLWGRGGYRDGRSIPPRPHAATLKQI
jgi:hypothetical protein